METRTVKVTTATPMKLEGYAVVFDSPAQLGEFTEIIQRDALKETDLSDVALFFNHNAEQIPLARTPNTLTLILDDRGLKFSAQLPETEQGRAIYEAVKRGDLRGCSFAFSVSSDSWSGNCRTITAIDKILECSVCTYPAYQQTSVEARQKGQSEMENQEFGTNAQILLRNVAGINADNRTFDAETVLETPEYRSAFFKSLQGKELTQLETAAMNVARADFEKRGNEFNTSTNSAAVIPTSTLDEIISTARKQGGLLAECRMFAVPSNVAIPVATPKSKAQWHVESAAVDTEKIDLTNSITFSGHEIIKIFSVSLKIQNMAIGAFESYLTQELTDCVMATIEEGLISGTGSGQGTGILSAFDSTNTVTATTVIKYSDVIAAVAKLQRGYANGAKWAMNNRTLWTTFYGMTDENKRPLFIADLQNQSVGRILGFDVVIDDNLDDNVVIFGNFSYMAYNLPAGIVIETSRESSFKAGLIDFRAIAIADTKPLLKDAFVKLTI